METDNVERDLRSLRRLYSLLETNTRNQYIPEAYLLDENTKFLLKRLLDSATQQLFVRQSKILAAQLGLPPKPDLHSLKPSNVADSSAMSSQINGSQIMQSGKPLEAKGTLKRDLRVNQIQSNSSKDGLTEQVADAIEQIETQLSALSFCSRRVYSDDTTRSCKLVTTPIEERRQSFEPSMAGLRSNYNMPMSQTSVNNAAGVTVRSYDDPILPPDRIRPRPPLPPLPLRSVGFKEPSQSNRTSHKMLSMKPTLLDQETETWDEDSSETESGKVRSWTGSEDDEELVSTEQESEETSGEIESNSGSSWETQAENVTGSESDSSDPPQSDDDDDESEASVYPPHKKRDRSSDPAKQRKKAMGRFKRFKNKLGQVFHHHHHHHHHHDKNQGSKPSAWKHLQLTFHQKHKDKSRSKTESKGLTTYKQHRGGQFHTLVEGLMRHRRHSKKQKHKLQSHGKKTHWWQTLKKRQGGVKFPNKGHVKLGKKHYLSKKVQEEN